MEFFGDRRRPDLSFRKTFIVFVSLLESQMYQSALLCANSIERNRRMNGKSGSNKNQRRLQKKSLKLDWANGVDVAPLVALSKVPTE